MDINELDTLSREELIGRARQLGVSKPELLTRVELKDEIIRLVVPDEQSRRQLRGWLGVARDLLASVVEQGLHLPDAAALIRGDIRVTDPVRPDKPVATVTLAEIYAAQGFPERALTILDEVLANEPDHHAAAELRQQIERRSSVSGRRAPGARIGMPAPSAPTSELASGGDPASPAPGEEPIAVASEPNELVLAHEAAANDVDRAAERAPESVTEWGEGAASAWELAETRAHEAAPADEASEAAEVASVETSTWEAAEVHAHEATVLASSSEATEPADRAEPVAEPASVELPQAEPAYEEPPVDDGVTPVEQGYADPASVEPPVGRAYADPASAEPAVEPAHVEPAYEEEPASEEQPAAAEPAAPAPVPARTRRTPPVVALFRSGRRIAIYWELEPGVLEQARTAHPERRLVVHVVLLRPSWSGALRSELSLGLSAHEGVTCVDGPAEECIVRAALGFETDGEFRPLVVASELALDADDRVLVRYVPPAASAAPSAAYDRAVRRIQASLES